MGVGVTKTTFGECAFTAGWLRILTRLLLYCSSGTWVPGPIVGHPKYASFAPRSMILKLLMMETYTRIAIAYQESNVGSTRIWKEVRQDLESLVRVVATDTVRGPSGYGSTSRLHL